MFTCSDGGSESRTVTRESWPLVSLAVSVEFWGELARSEASSGGNPVGPANAGPRVVCLPSRTGSIPNPGPNPATSGAQEPPERGDCRARRFSPLLGRQCCLSAVAVTTRLSWPEKKTKQQRPVGGSQYLKFRHAFLAFLASGTLGKTSLDSLDFPERAKASAFKREEAGMAR